MTTQQHPPISLMEPLLLSENIPNRTALLDLALELTAKSAAFKALLPSAIQASLADTVRAMNCYYSNLIEGHNTHPIAIEEALHGHFDKDPKKRDLQLEAKAHIKVQEWIDQGGIKKNLFSANTIREIHKRFYRHLPDGLLWIEEPTTKKRVKVIPGEFRKCNVKVGNHIPINPNVIPLFLKRYEEVYSRLGKSETILALAAAHHRLLWIHPFLDGNGRVARFVSYATVLNTLHTGGLWSIARGLAKNVIEYKQHLANCDLARRNDLDGRGNLSQEELIKFTEFFITICIDQVDFMQSLMEPAKLRTRILLWAKEEIASNQLPHQAIPLLEHILYKGELERSEIPSILNLTDRHARRITATLINKGVFYSATTKSPIRLAFPAKLANRFMPGLFPEK